MTTTTASADTLEATASVGPLEAFRMAQREAQRTEPLEATAMTLATVDERGWPSARIVLLKEVDERGFVFYTNFGSRKARELEASKRAALCIHWASRTQQVRVEGTIERVSDEEADLYFASRPRGSQIGAWASRQSEDLESRQLLDARVAEYEAKFGDGPVPRPPFWGGYRLVAERIEFWYGHDDRLHDRDLFEKTEQGWKPSRLYP